MRAGVCGPNWHWCSSRHLLAAVSLTMPSFPQQTPNFLPWGLCRSAEQTCKKRAPVQAQRGTNIMTGWLVVQHSLKCRVALPEYSGIACWLLLKQASEPHAPVSPATRLGRPSVSPGTSKWPSSRSAAPARHTTRATHHGTPCYVHPIATHLHCAFLAINPQFPSKRCSAESLAGAWPPSCNHAQGVPGLHLRGRCRWPWAAVPVAKGHGTSRSAPRAPGCQ